MRKTLKSYLSFILVSVGTGLLSALLTMGNMDLYSEITRPPLSPPPFIFPVVWTILYILMGVSAARVWNRLYDEPILVGGAMRIFAIQLAVNFLWSIIFFNLRAYLFAFIWLLLLWALIALMIIRFGKVDPLAAKLQIPYLLWVTFAGYLTLAIYLLNR